MGDWWRWLKDEVLFTTAGRWLLVALILGGGYFVARLIAPLLSRVVYTFLGKAQQHISRNELHRLLRPAWLFALFLLALYTSGSIVNFLNLAPAYVSWIKRVFEALALLSLGIFASRLLAVAEAILASQYEAAGETYKRQLVHPFFTVGRIVLFLLVIFLMVEHTLGVNVAPFLTTLGLGGLAVALAAQETLQHFIGAMVIVAEKPFQVGEIIRLDANTAGTVEKIGLRSTHIRTFDNLLLVIPNKKLVDSPLENLTRNRERRIVFRIGLVYSTPTETLERVIAALQEELAGLPFLTRPPMVLFTNFQDSALEVMVALWVDLMYQQEPGAPPLSIFFFQEKAAWIILRTVRRFAPETGFAFPSRSLYIESLPQNASVSQVSSHRQ